MGTGRSKEERKVAFKPGFASWRSLGRWFGGIVEELCRTWSAGHGGRHSLRVGSDQLPAQPLCIMSLRNTLHISLEGICPEMSFSKHG